MYWTQTFECCSCLVPFIDQDPTQDWYESMRPQVRPFAFIVLKVITTFNKGTRGCKTRSVEGTVSESFIVKIRRQTLSKLRVSQTRCIGSFVHGKDKQSLKILSHQTFHHKHLWDSQSGLALQGASSILFWPDCFLLEERVWPGRIFVFLCSMTFSPLVTHKCHSLLFLSRNCENCSFFLLYMPIK